MGNATHRQSQLSYLFRAVKQHQAHKTTEHIRFLSICTSIYSDPGLSNLQDKRKNKHAFNLCLGPPYSVLATAAFQFLKQVAVPT